VRCIRVDRLGSFGFEIGVDELGVADFVEGVAG
jgi:hypothetical protein